MRPRTARRPVGREPDQAHARVGHLQEPHEFDARIGRSVVDDDHLGRILDGLEHRLELFPEHRQALGFVEDGKDDRELDRLRLHAPPLPRTTISSFATRRAATTRHDGCAWGWSPVHDLRDMITAPLAELARSCSTRPRSSSTTGRRR